MGTRGEWRSTEVIAWTRHDGATTPPRGPGRAGPLTLAGALAVVLVGMVGFDTLCPEHRAWVYLLAGIGFVGSIAAIVGLIQAWAMAPLFTVLVALTGVSIGLVDAIHQPTQGRLIALGFGACAVLAALLTARAVPLALWERRVRRGLVAPPVPQDAPGAGAGAPPAPADADADAEAEARRGAAGGARGGSGRSAGTGRRRRRGRSRAPPPGVKLPEPLRAHRARLLPWVVAGLAMTVLTVGWDAKDARDNRRWARTALAAEGEVREGYTGGAQIPVAYTNPVTDQRVELTVYTWGAPPDVDVGDPIALEVDPDDPELVSAAGDRMSYFNPLDTFEWVAFALAWYGWRWWSVRRTARLAEADAPAFALLGAIAPPARFRRRPVLHLYALDAPPGARSLCSARLLSTGGCPLAGPAFAVEVKGVPRTGGRVVARAPGSGAVLWPVGHAAGHRSWLRPERLADVVPPPPAPAEDTIPPRSRPGWWPPALTPVTVLLVALVAGVALAAPVTAVTLVRGMAYEAKPAGWVPAVAEVVERGDYSVGVRLAVGGEERTQSAAALYPEDYTVGRRYPVTYDPDQPSHVRLSREGYDESSPIFFAVLPAAAAAVSLFVAVRRSRRAWALAREGPWYRLDLWAAPGGEASLGDRAADYVRAVIPRRWSGRLMSRLNGPELEPGPVVVAGVPEPGEVAAVIDAEGTVLPVSRRLRVPSADAVVPPAPAGAWPAYVIRGPQSWVAPTVIGLPFVIVIPAVLGEVAGWAAAVSFVVAAAALVAALARIRVVVDADGVAMCDGLGTRRIAWADVEHVRDGHRGPQWRRSTACLEITVRGEHEPLMPRATLRSTPEELQPALEVIRQYAPAGTRVARWDGGGVSATS